MNSKRYKHTKETKRKMRESHKGKHHTEETKRKISRTLKGLLKDGVLKSPAAQPRDLAAESRRRKKISRFQRGKEVSEETRKRMSEARKGTHPSEETRKKQSEVRKGRMLSKETRRKMSNAQKGEKSHLWKGGINSINDTIRKSIEYRLWREAVFARDSWTCQKTGERGGELHSHHIKSFARYPELRFAIDNGITLSKKSHKEFHKICGKQNNTRKQLEEFLIKS